MDRWILTSKGVIVEAVQLTAENVDAIAEWTGGRVVEETDAISNRMYDSLNIPTPHGYKRLSLGMYVVKFNGMFYLAKRGVFELQYKRMTPLAAAPNTAAPKQMGTFNRAPWFDQKD